MVARMIRWPWPPIMLRKFKARLVVRGIKGVTLESPGEEQIAEGFGRMTAEVRWKGPKTTALSSLRRTVKRNCTKAEAVKGNQGEVDWNEAFDAVVGLTEYKLNAFNPWEIEIVVFYGLKKVFKNKASMIGTASLNLAEYASTFGEELELNLPVLIAGADPVSQPTLHLTLKLMELRTCPESLETVASPVILASASPPPSRAVSSSGKNDLSALKAGLRKVKMLKEFVSPRKPKKMTHEDEGSDGRCSSGSEDADYAYPLDTDSLEENPEDELKDGNADTSIRKSFSYGSLSAANYADGLFFSDIPIDEYEDLVYYSHRRSDVGCSHAEEASSSLPKQSIFPASKRSILPWKKRKYGFRSPNSRGEPLLKKAYEEGGDDIDYDRRQLSSSDESHSLMGHKSDDDASSAHHSSVSDFGDDYFAVGIWESKEITSRDGRMKLYADVFFSAIDQRSERAAGHSACTSLTVVIAEWFKLNNGMMPVKSQFDSLIREGSSEWRNLCQNEMYTERFPDKHFDLETVLQAKTRDLSIVPGKSFVGFFQPEGYEDIRGFDFLHGVMSFDEIWSEIASSESDCLYIVSWNDHFFVLKVERDAYYIVDTLGERLYEGCTQGYILKFSRSTVIRRTLNQKANKVNSKDGEISGSEDEPVCAGKECCKEYIKSFLAAVPIRELQADMKKGFVGSAPLHSRLQVEFHYAEVAKVADSIAAFSCQISRLEEPMSGPPTLTPGALIVV
ncbi:hypothetical protein KSP40_PGU012581 [Platanthera guangdongensis]|uniref:C2 NT-type domain-containing protein n=1 Tax=Platanthera guangdongensis TaxID=2320717 RepID=A0ABR2MKN5_9ASPA